MAVDTYIYKGALWCLDCIDEIKRNLDADGHAPKTPDDQFSYQSTDYPKGPYNEIQSHMPQHCSSCGEFLENPLTESGVLFVQKMIAAIKARGDAPSDAEMDIINFYGEKSKGEGP